MSCHFEHRLLHPLPVTFFSVASLLLFSSSAIAQSNEVTDLLNELINSRAGLKEVIVVVDQSSVTDQQGKSVAEMYRGDTLDVLEKSDGKYEVRSPKGWINAKDVLELDIALKSLSGRSRKRNDPNLIINRALVNDILGESEKAIVSLDKLLKKNPENVAALLARGRVFLRSAETTIKQPPEQILKAYRLEPNNLHALKMMIESYNAAGQSEKVLELLNDTTIDVNEHSDLLIEKGFAQWMTDQYEEALKSLNAAIKKGTRLPVAWMHRGNVYVSLGQDDQALLDLTKAIELDSFLEDAYYYRSDLYERNGELEKAIADCSRMIVLSDFPADGYITRGDLYRQLGQYEKAINDFDRALSFELDNTAKARTLFLRALAYDDTDQTEKALAGYAAALELDSNLVGPNRERARLLSTLGKWKEAESELQIAVKLDPRDDLAWRFLGDLYRITKRYQQALDAYEKALELAPENSSSWNNKALACEYLNNNALALKSYERAIELSRSNIVYRINAASLYRRMGNTEAALKHLSQALTLNKQADPEDRAELHFRRGEVYRFAEEYEKAIADLDIALKLQNNLALAYNSRGICYESLGKIEKAIENYNQAVKLEPENYIFFINRGDAFNKAGQGKNSYQDYTHAIELNSKSALAYRQRGVLLLDNAEYKGAIRDLEQALKLDPDYLAVKVDLADAYRYAGNYEKAIELFSQLLISNPQSAFIPFARADCYRNLGRYAEAEADYRAALKLNRKHSVSWVGLGQLYESQNRYQEAIEFYNQAIDISPDYITALYRKGFCLTMLRQYKESVKVLSEVLKRAPGHNGARLFRANNYRDLEEFEKAHRDYETAIQNDAKDPFIFLGRARCWEIQRQYRQALADYTRAINIETSQPIPLLFSERARLQGAVTDPKVFDPKQALLDAKKASQMTNNSNVQFLDTLAIAFAANGQFEEAVKTEEEVLALAKEKNYSEAELKQITARLNLYKNGKPYVLASKSAKPIPVNNKNNSTGNRKQPRGIGAGAQQLFGSP